MSFLEASGEGNIAEARIESARTVVIAGGWRNRTRGLLIGSASSALGSIVDVMRGRTVQSRITRRDEARGGPKRRRSFPHWRARAARRGVSRTAPSTGFRCNRYFGIRLVFYLQLLELLCHAICSAVYICTTLFPLQRRVPALVSTLSKLQPYTCTRFDKNFNSISYGRFKNSCPLG